MTDQILRRAKAETFARERRVPVDADTLAIASGIVEDVRERGEVAIREHAERLGDVEPNAPLVIGRAELQSALDGLVAEERELLERTAERIRSFAQAQRQSLVDARVDIPGGKAGHDVVPIASAGCYAPGGRFPLPSSVLMTAIPARVAGVERVVVASPRPLPVVLAAAAIAGADELLCVGGAQAIAALAYGGAVEPVDFIAGPGNRFVTAAKKLVFGEVGLDGLAGPSELVVVADDSADVELLASDLLAVAEHDDDAVAILISTSEEVADAMDEALEAQLKGLATAGTARVALERNGVCVLARDLAEAATVSDRIAPEHLSLHVANAESAASHFDAFGTLFIGEGSAEVLGDYGAGPNHVLPTGGTARFSGGLSVMDFLRVRTWLQVDDASVASDAALLGRLEGLEAHARSADRRTGGKSAASV